MNGAEIKKTLASGFTLVEVMLALVLGVFLGGTILSGLEHANRWNYGVGQHMAAFALCQERFEQIRSMPYDEIDKNSANAGPSNLTITHLGGKGKKKLKGKIDVEVDVLSDPDRKRITVIIEWGHHNREMTETLSGMVYRKD